MIDSNRRQTCLPQNFPLQNRASMIRQPNLREAATVARSLHRDCYQDQKKEAQDLEDIYQRLSAEVRSQYLMTYCAKSQAAGVKFRSIRVLAKRPGLQVRARQGYYVNSPL